MLEKTEQFPCIDDRHSDVGYRLNALVRRLAAEQALGTDDHVAIVREVLGHLIVAFAVEDPCDAVLHEVESSAGCSRPLDHLVPRIVADRDDRAQCTFVLSAQRVDGMKMLKDIHQCELLSGTDAILTIPQRPRWCSIPWSS